MLSETLTGYVSTLKPGDEVIIDVGRYGSTKLKPGVVSHVTATGRVVTRDGRTFNTDGYERRSTDGWGGRDRIVEPTDENRERAQRTDLIRRIEDGYEKAARVGWKDTPTGELCRLADAFDA